MAAGGDYLSASLPVTGADLEKCGADTAYNRSALQPWVAGANSLPRKQTVNNSAYELSA